MKHRFDHEARQQTDEESTVIQNDSITFDSVDDLLRHDAANTRVPPDLQERVMRSAARESLEEIPLPWWKRWMPF